MTDDDATRLTLRLGTLGRWTEDATAEMYNALIKLSDVNAAEAAVDSVIENWTESFRPTIAFVRTEYAAKHMAVLARRSIGGRMVTPGCDGSRWTTNGDFSEPCPRCNPVLHTLWRSGDDWSAYLKGVPVEVFDNTKVDIPACAPEQYHDPGAQVVPPSRGYDLAMAGHVQDCAQRGIEIDVDKVHRIIGVFVGDRGARFRVPETKAPSTPPSRSSALGSAAASPAASDAPGTAVHTPGT